MFTPSKHHIHFSWMWMHATFSESCFCKARDGLREGDAESAERQLPANASDKQTEEGHFSGRREKKYCFSVCAEGDGLIGSYLPINHDILYSAEW